MIIALDAMGGDYAPAETIAAAVEWVNNQASQLVLVGDEEIISGALKAYAYPEGRLRIVHAPQVVEMKESASAALMGKKNSSITVATQLVKNGEADALVSCGNTGAQMAAALFVLGRFPGIDRPPVIAGTPNRLGKTTYVIDIGANVDCKAAQLVQFAALGSVYAELMAGIASPRIALLNNGEEESKGNAVAADTHQMLKMESGLNFIGNVEGKDLFDGKADVVVCDGFVGNILLKTMEGMAAFLMEILGSGGSQVRVLDAYDKDKVGGSPLLGVEGISIVCHGSSKRKAVYNGIRVAVECLERQLVAGQKQILAGLAGTPQDL